MNNEYEIINHPRMKHFNPFVVNLSFRNSHLHNDFEICLLLKGECTVNSKKESYYLNKDSIILFNPIQPHEIMTQNNSALILSLQISNKFCVNYYPAISNTNFSVSNLTPFLSEDDNRMLISLIIQLSSAYFKHDYGYEFKCLSLINHLFYTLFQLIPHASICDEERAKNLQRLHRVNRIISYIEENYSSKLFLSTIAEREELSLTYLSHFFKDNLNTTFQNYLNQVRLNKAKQLILQTNMKLIDICLECGFSDTRYLNNMFFKQFGCTPTEYRNNNKQCYDVSPRVDLSNAQRFYSDVESLTILKKYADGLIEQQ